MAKKSLIEELIELAADFTGGFIVLLVITLPIAYMVHGWEGVAISIFVVVIIASCLIFSGNDDKKENKYGYNPKMKKCPNCGKEIADFAQVCKYCRAKLKSEPTTKKMKMKMQKCPYCGKEIIENAFKCKYCKKKLR